MGKEKGKSRKDKESSIGSADTRHDVMMVCR
jgi:hypothetical protein